MWFFCEEDMSKHGSIPICDCERARERNTSVKGGYPSILDRVLVAVLFIVGIVILYQMHMTNSILLDLSVQLEKLTPQPLDTIMDKDLQEIMNLDWTIS